MKWASLGVCALLLTMGCQSVDLALTGSGGDVAIVRLVDGAPDMVAISLQESLKRRGFDAIVAKQGDDIVVQSKSSTGAQFALLLTRAASDIGSAQTRVALEWMGGADDAATNLILLAVGGQASTKK